MAQNSAKSVDTRGQDRRVRRDQHVLLLNPRFESEMPEAEASRLFDPDAWGNCSPVSTGRGANWFVDNGSDQFVLRHFQRGGAVARLLGDKYWFANEDATRSFAEYRLLRKLSSEGLLVPEPVAAGYRRQGPWYTAQLITKRIPHAHSWSHLLLEAATSDDLWSGIGVALATLHRACIDHADLNAHNILVDDAADVFVIDFDKSVARPSIDGRWRDANLARLKRSLYKILPARHALINRGWSLLTEAYQRELGR